MTNTEPKLTSANPDETLAWKILSRTLRADLDTLRQNELELNRLNLKRDDLRACIGFIEEAISKLGGDLEEARKL